MIDDGFNFGPFTVVRDDYVGQIIFYSGGRWLAVLDFFGGWNERNENGKLSSLCSATSRLTTLKLSTASVRPAKNGMDKIPLTSSECVYQFTRPRIFPFTRMT
ncbi:hypothetical protein E1B28_013796 [Marasmius oreades]|uniref:Uncharacterized protein n=1 Tax=Marasmius oreades TaxID=181124 RepID=A0A9P7UN49_9AGAR|nr:uncharacterized protein E1B28_013796 [Marasmius oreades]KAG7087858.1 hypothetical protein E1B28_013796 [Marasmius oreades]